MTDSFAPRVPYAMPASHKGYSAYSRETYTGGELNYRGKPAPTPQHCELCRDSGGYFYGKTGYEPCCI